MASFHRAYPLLIFHFKSLFERITLWGEKAPVRRLISWSLILSVCLIPIWLDLVRSFIWAFDLNSHWWSWLNFYLWTSTSTSLRLRTKQSINLLSVNLLTLFLRLLLVSSELEVWIRASLFEESTSEWTLHILPQIIIVTVVTSYRSTFFNIFLTCHTLTVFNHGPLSLIFCVLFHRLFMKDFLSKDALFRLLLILM